VGSKPGFCFLFCSDIEFCIFYFSFLLGLLVQCLCRLSAKLDNAIFPVDLVCIVLQLGDQFELNKIIIFYIILLVELTCTFLDSSGYPTRYPATCYCHALSSVVLGNSVVACGVACPCCSWLGYFGVIIGAISAWCISIAWNRQSFPSHRRLTLTVRAASIVRQFSSRFCGTMLASQARLWEFIHQIRKFNI